MSDESRLELEGITHRYGTVTALQDVSLTISDGEFVTLLGPSGCGKTTLLRIVAGFIRPSEGRLLLQGRDVTRIPPHRRPVNMVFQRAALFPHLDVFENVAFGLRVSGAPDIEARVTEALRLVRLVGFERRRAHELSGGQLQRVALARALVNRPRVLLLDEPLAALDLRIRLEMEAELRRVHRETGATFVYVTHDQGEALALSDRIVVFDQGNVEQVGTPDEIYRRPATPFAARFVGDANVLPVHVVELSGTRATVDLAGIRFSRRAMVSQPVPDGSSCAPRSSASEQSPATGCGAWCGTSLSAAPASRASSTSRAFRAGESGALGRVRAPPELGSAVGIAWDSEAVCLLPEAGLRGEPMLVYIEYISRRPGVSIEAFHFAAGRGQGGWASEYAGDILLLNLGRTFRLGPEPEYVAVWYVAGAGLERIGEWERIFASGEADHFEETFRLAARIDTAGCYEPLLEPVQGRDGLYYGEYLDFAPGVGRDELRLSSSAETVTTA